MDRAAALLFIVGVAAILPIDPTSDWDFSEGIWSTFGFQIGTPPQQVRLLPATSLNAITPILSLACSIQDRNCPDNRGGVFNFNASNSWTYINQYAVVLTNEAPLGYVADHGLFGFDNFSTNFPGSPGCILQNQVIEAIANDDFNLGLFGLQPYSINLTNLTNSYLSPLSALKDNGNISSLSWAYTAGGSWRNPRVSGSLTLGGYDTTRSTGPNTTFPFGTDMTRDLVVGLKSITAQPTLNVDVTALLPNPIPALIDSTVPAIWLPVDACQLFESAFNLTYNSTANLYTLNSSQHAALSRLNPQIIFSIGASLGVVNPIDIIIPYSAFDLQTTIGGVVFNYFPIRQAQSEAQYTLGRTFLQSAYVVTDYERQTFTVAQAAYPSTGGRDLVAILSTFTPSATPIPKHSSSHTGAIVGGIVGGVVGGAVILGVFFFLFRRHRRATRAAESEAAKSSNHHRYLSDMTQTSENGVTTEGSSVLPKIGSPALSSELQGSAPMTPELVGSEAISGSTVGSEGRRSPLGDTIHELDATPTPQELWGGGGSRKNRPGVPPRERTVSRGHNRTPSIGGVMTGDAANTSRPAVGDESSEARVQAGPTDETTKPTDGTASPEK